MNNKSNRIDIELNDTISEGSYANLAMIAHSSSEFVLDFINVMPGVPKAKVRSRIILTPEHTKKLINALNENLIKYEKAFGEIKNSQREVLPISFGPRGEA